MRRVYNFSAETLLDDEGLLDPKSLGNVSTLVLQYFLSWPTCSPCNFFFQNQVRITFGFLQNQFLPQKA